MISILGVMKLLFVLILPLLLSGCFFSQKILVYTTLPPEIIREMMSPLAKRVSMAKVDFVQGSSASIRAKLNEEFAQNNVQADLVLMDDPLWFEEQKKLGHLLKYESAPASAVPIQYRDSDLEFVSVRLPIMVMAYHSQVIEPKDLPTRWSELPDPKWKDKLVLGNPLHNETYQFAITRLAKLYGWPYFSRLMKLNPELQDDPAVVVNQILNKSRPLGMALMEKVLLAKSMGGPIRMIYPLDGSIPVPTFIAVLKDSRSPRTARKVYDWFFSPQAQSILVQGGVYSPVPGIIWPDRARPWKELQYQITPWSSSLLSEIAEGKDQSLIQMKSLFEGSHP